MRNLIVLTCTGHYHHWTTALGRIPFYFGRRRLPTANHQSFHYSGMHVCCGRVCIHIFLIPLRYRVFSGWDTRNPMPSGRSKVIVTCFSLPRPKLTRFCCSLVANRDLFLGCCCIPSVVPHFRNKRWNLQFTVLVAPFLHPANGKGDTPPLPYYLYGFYDDVIFKDAYWRTDSRYCLVGIAIMVFGVLYWAAWRVLLPRVFGYELVPRKEKLDDGTVVTLVSLILVRTSKACWSRPRSQFSRKKI